jgi:hypothetical protein
VHYEVMCVCGELQRGARRRQFQVVACANCGRHLFVLPRSPRDGSDDLSDSALTLPAARARLRWWGLPLLVGAGSALLAVTVFLAARPHLQRGKSSPEQPDGGGAPQDLWGMAETAQRLMGQGKFHLARAAFADVVRGRDLHPDRLSPAQHRRLNQWQRQADLLARLAPVPLEEVVRQCTLERDPAEGLAFFAENFRGRTYVFDDVVRPDVEGRPALGYVVKLKGSDVPVRLALEDLDELRDLPLDDAPRLIFGARLAGCDREGEGRWVVRFAPNSGVLLTDVEAAEAASSRSLDPGLKDVLARQQRWLDERRAVVAPARP